MAQSLENELLLKMFVVTGLPTACRENHSGESERLSFCRIIFEVFE